MAGSFRHNEPSPLTVLHNTSTTTHYKVQARRAERDSAFQHLAPSKHNHSTTQLRRHDDKTTTTTSQPCISASFIIVKTQFFFFSNNGARTEDVPARDGQEDCQGACKHQPQSQCRRCCELELCNFSRRDEQQLTIFYFYQIFLDYLLFMQTYAQSPSS